MSATSSPRPWPLRWLLAVGGVALATTWTSVFPPEPQKDWVDIVAEGAYLGAAVAAYFIVVRFRVALLEAGWIVFMAALAVEVADEFTLEPRLFSDTLPATLTVGGLLMAAVGFHAATQQRQREAEERRRAEEATRRARDEAEAANQRLREALRHRDELVSIVAHDFSSPLMVILSYTQMLDQTLEEPEARRMLAQIETTTRHLSTLAANTLTMSSLESGRLPLERQAVPVADLLRSVVQGLSRAEGPRIGLEVPACDIEVDADPSRLRQVFDNLIANAVRHSRSEGAVRVRMQAQEGGVLVTVSDEGRGIAAEHLPSLFQKFSRLDPARGQGAGGTGLGLYICRSIVEAHGGRISVESQAGLGARFEVWLPGPQGGSA